MIENDDHNIIEEFKGENYAIENSHKQNELDINLKFNNETHKLEKENFDLTC